MGRAKGRAARGRGDEPLHDARDSQSTPSTVERNSRWPWAVALSVLGLTCAWLGASAAGGAIAGIRGPRPPFLERKDRPRGAPARESSAHDLVIAGSGSNVPVTRMLVGAFTSARAAGCEQDCPDAVRAWITSSGEIRVEPSIGSTGGVKALLDGAIDVALVSRPLADEEQARGLVAHPYARTAVVLCTNSRVLRESISAVGLLDIYRGTRRTWSDGQPLVLLQRELGDSSHAAVARKLEGFAAADEAARANGVHPVYHHDAELEGALLATPGAVGLCDLGSLRVQDLPAGALPIGGGVDAPTLTALADGSYPYAKDLAFVTRGEPRGLAAALLHFVRSATAAELLRAAAYLPLPTTTAEEISP